MPQTSPHIAVFPSSGMGHLMPHLRLASELLRRGCSITLITSRPVVSDAESAHIDSFLLHYPQVNAIDLHLVPYDKNLALDPFFLQWGRICQSTEQLLRPLLSSVKPPLAAIFADLLVAKEISPITTELSIALYLFSTTSVSFFSLMAHLPKLVSDPSTFNLLCSEVTVPGILQPVPVKSIPPPFFEYRENPFTSIILKSCQALCQSRGILMNSFDWLEPSTLSALNHHRVQQSLPPILPVGPLQPSRSNDTHSMEEDLQEWLGHQETKSVMLVSFGSRTAMSAEQIRELGDGLVRSGCKFIWVLKTSKVDRDDDVSNDDDVRALLGETLWEKTKDKGKVVRRWVDQSEILSSPFIGGFLSHGGWNSVMESSLAGVPMLVWPLHGDQRFNAKVVEDAGLGIWMEGWGMGNNRDIVRGEEIGLKIMEMMNDEGLRQRADKVKQEAVKAVGVGGSSDNVLDAVIESLSIDM